MDSTGGDTEELLPDQRSLRTRYGTQIVSSFAASLGLMTVGTVSSWTSTALPSLEHDPLFSNLTTTDTSWIASLVPLGASISGPLVGVSIDKYGRKFTMILHAILLLIGWLTIGFSRTNWSLYLGRFITGLCNGFGILAPTVYITDICESGIRGAMATISHIMASLGVLLSFVIGSEIPWNYSAMISLSVPLTYLLLVILFDKESPRYYMDHGKAEEAKGSLKYFRTGANEEDIDSELDSIRESLEHERQDSASLRTLVETGSLRPLGLGLILVFFQQFCGFNALLYFTVSIFQSSGSSIDANWSSISIAVSMVLTVPVASTIVDRAGRRFLLFFSGIMLTLSLGSLGGFFYLKEHGNEDLVAKIGWVPLLSILIYFAAFAVGYQSVPWLIIAETVPNHFVGKATGICISAHFMFGFLITKYFQVISEGIGNSWSFWIFGLITISGLVFMYFFVPETKLKTLEEIQSTFSKDLLRRSSLGGNISPSLSALSAHQSTSSATYNTFTNK